MKIAIVVPAHIPMTVDFVQKLNREALDNNADVIIVDDSDGHLGSLPYNGWRVYNYAKQKEFLGDLYEVFANLFHKCSACRIFGHIVAYSEGYEIVIGLDSDCEVREGFIKEHLEMLDGTYKGCGWENPLSNLKDYYSRGFPYFMRDWPIVANMGMWEKCLDINGKDRRENESKTVNYPKDRFEIAAAPIPFSGMNFAMKREALPGFLFLPNFDYIESKISKDSAIGNIDKFRRIDDIWGGYIFQKLAQKKREAVSYGYPIVDHISEVIASEDAAEEAAMYKWEEQFIKMIDDTANTVQTVFHGNYLSYAEAFALFVERIKVCTIQEPFKNLIPAMEWWVKVWEKYGK